MLALFVRRGESGGFALVGLKYLIAAKEKGETKKGKLVTESWVVLVDAKSQVSITRVVDHITAHEMQHRLAGVAPRPSQFGWGKYFWVEPQYGGDEVF